MKDEGEEIEGQDRVDAFGKLVKEGLEVAMLGNGFADVEEGLELAARLFDGRSGLGRGRRRTIDISHNLRITLRFGGSQPEGIWLRNPASSVYSQRTFWMMMDGCGAGGCG